MEKKRTKKTETNADLFKVGLAMGDTLRDTFDENNDINRANSAIGAYRMALKSQIVEIQLKKLEG